MKAKGAAGPTLAKGQLWKVDDGYIQIVQLGKKLVHYKMLRQPQQRAVMTRMMPIEGLAAYLKHSEAKLVV